MFTPLKLVIDSRLEHGAAIGLHAHADNEGLYYLLEGSLRMTTVAGDSKGDHRPTPPRDATVVVAGAKAPDVLLPLSGCVQSSGRGFSFMRTSSGSSV